MKIWILWLMFVGGFEDVFDLLNLAHAAISLCLISESVLSDSVKCLPSTVIPLSFCWCPGRHFAARWGRFVM